jgi:hypothetical protein
MIKRPLTAYALADQTPMVTRLSGQSLTVTETLAGLVCTTF